MPNFSFTYKNGAVLEYGHGKFDDWCVFLTRPDEEKFAPKDREYFFRLKRYDTEIGGGLVYNNLVRIYDKTTKVPNKVILEKIEEYCLDKYSYLGDDEAMCIAIDYGIIYMGMVAEENKANTFLGKRIKRLGLHQVLVENMEHVCAASYSKEIKHEELDKICKQYGF